MYVATCVLVNTPMYVYVLHTYTVLRTYVWKKKLEVSYVCNQNCCFIHIADVNHEPLITANCLYSFSHELIDHHYTSASGEQYAVSFNEYIEIGNNRNNSPQQYNVTSGHDEINSNRNTDSEEVSLYNLQV